MRSLIKEKKLTAKPIATNEVDAKDASARNSVVLSNIVMRLHKFFQETGKQKAIIGISGGIDSAVCAHLCCKALGSSNVIGISMPSIYSSRDSVDDAIALSESLGFKLLGMSIQSIHTEYASRWLSLFKEDISGVADENIQARIRGNILMTYANMHEGLVIETCNKTESMMGYCTLYGDTCGAISPIGNIYKTELYYLVKEFINKDYEIIPKSIVDKEPSAELRDGQKDSDDIPPYEILDAILISYFEENVNIDAITRIMSADGVDSGLPVEVIEQTAKMAFKREQSPKPIKICHDF